MRNFLIIVIVALFLGGCFEKSIGPVNNNESVNSVDTVVIADSSAILHLIAGSSYVIDVSIYDKETLLYNDSLPFDLTVKIGDILNTKFYASNFGWTMTCDCILPAGNSDFECKDTLLISEKEMTWIIGEKKEGH